MLAGALGFLESEKERVIVLAIPRGGVLVAKEVAASLGAPLDLVITRKIGAPGNPELAVGAVTSDGEIIRDEEMVDALKVSEGYLKKEAAKEAQEIGRRMREYRGDRPYPSLAGKTVVLVDDGVATGSTVRAAIESIKRRQPGKIILAVPVGPSEAMARLSKMVDRVVCLETPGLFYAVGQFYEEFGQVDDNVVTKTLRAGPGWA